MPPAGVLAQTSIEPIFQDSEKLGAPKFVGHKPEPTEVFEDAPLSTALVAYCNLALLLVFGYIRDFLRFFGYEATIGAKEFANEVNFVLVVLFR